LVVVLISRFLCPNALHFGRLSAEEAYPFDWLPFVDAFVTHFLLGCGDLCRHGWALLPEAFE